MSRNPEPEHKGDTMKTWNVELRTYEPDESGCYYTTISVEASNAGDAIVKAYERFGENEICEWLLAEPADV